MQINSASGKITTLTHIYKYNILAFFRQSFNCFPWMEMLGDTKTKAADFQVGELSKVVEMEWDGEEEGNREDTDSVE